MHHELEQRLQLGVAQQPLQRLALQLGHLLVVFACADVKQHPVRPGDGAGCVVLYPGAVFDPDPAPVGGAQAIMLHIVLDALQALGFDLGVERVQVVWVHQIEVEQVLAHPVGGAVAPLAHVFTHVRDRTAFGSHPGDCHHRRGIDGGGQKSRAGMTRTRGVGGKGMRRFHGKWQ